MPKHWVGVLPVSSCCSKISTSEGVLTANIRKTRKRNRTCTIKNPTTPTTPTNQTTQSSGLKVKKRYEYKQKQTIKPNADLQTKTASKDSRKRMKSGTSKSKKKHAPLQSRSRGNGSDTTYSTMSEMLRAGVIQSGKNVFRITYKQKIFYADLTQKGEIKKGKRTFATPSGLSAFVKEMPDNGWTSIYYKNKKLSDYRKDKKRKMSSKKPSDKRKSQGGSTRVPTEKLRQPDAHRIELKQAKKAKQMRKQMSKQEQNKTQRQEKVRVIEREQAKRAKQQEEQREIQERNQMWHEDPYTINLIEQEQAKEQKQEKEQKQKEEEYKHRYTLLLSIFRRKQDRFHTLTRARALNLSKQELQQELQNEIKGHWKQNRVLWNHMPKEMLNMKRSLKKKSNVVTQKEKEYRTLFGTSHTGFFVCDSCYWEGGRRHCRLDE